MEIEFEGELWHWRGPAPYHFIWVPEGATDGIRELAPIVSYGWGVIPVSARIGGSQWTTSLFPKDGHYALPIKDAIRKAEAMTLGDTVTVELRVGA
jgi:hypothetical protein